MSLSDTLMVFWMGMVMEMELMMDSVVAVMVVMVVLPKELLLD